VTLSANRSQHQMTHSMMQPTGPVLPNLGHQSRWQIVPVSRVDCCDQCFEMRRGIETIG